MQTNENKPPFLSEEDLAVLQSQNPRSEDLPFQIRVLAKLLQTVPASSHAEMIRQTMLAWKKHLHKATTRSDAAGNEARFRLFALNAVKPQLQLRHASPKVLRSIQEERRWKLLNAQLKKKLASEGNA
jgi:hypothetical protein